MTLRARNALLFVGARPGLPLLERRARRAVCRRVCAQYGAGAAGSALLDADGSPRLHVVFVAPQIHWNTGNIGRTCLGLGAGLHLVGPLGFGVDEKQVRRAGLDYWEHVDVQVYDDWEQFANGKLKELGGTRFFFTKFGAEPATNVQWPSEGKIVLLFGSEIDGFTGIQHWLDSEGATDRKVAFPMCSPLFRSFNLSTTASMALWDAYKTLDAVRAVDNIAPSSPKAAAAQ